MITLDKCPICASSAMPYQSVVTPINRQLECEIDGLPISIHNTYEECLNCGVVFQNPRMSDDELDIYYRKLYRPWLNATQEELDADEIKRGTRVWEYLRTKVSPKSMIDYGSSLGYLCSIASSSGVESVFGVEPNAEYSKYSVPIRDMELIPDAMDLITCVHVMEHVTSPMRLLSKFHSKLDKDGHLYVETPLLEPLRLPHLYFFRPNVMVSLLRTAGFRPLELTVTNNLGILARKITNETKV